MIVRKVVKIGQKMVHLVFEWPIVQCKTCKKKVFETNPYIYKIIFDSKLNVTEKNYEKNKKFSNSKVLNQPKPAQISDSIS